MKMLLSILIFLTPFISSAQSSTTEKLTSANNLFKNKDYTAALSLYKQLHTTTKSTDALYPQITYGVCGCLYHLRKDAIKKDDWNLTIELSKNLINTLEKDKAVLPVEFQNDKYWACKDIVVAYFGLNKIDSASVYQKKLYKAYKDNELPKGLGEYYNFEKITVDGLNVWGYEWYASLGDKETEGSFSKHVYYIYSRDENGGDKEELYTLQTVKVHKFKNDEPDYVLTKRTQTNNEEISETIWQRTFNSPIDYKLLHNSVVDYINGKLSTDTKSTIKR